MISRLLLLINKYNKINMYILKIDPGCYPGILRKGPWTKMAK